VLNNLPLSYPADLWALGCVIYQVGPDLTSVTHPALQHHG
jgi:hypothetical protein